MRLHSSLAVIGLLAACFVGGCSRRESGAGAGRAKVVRISQRNEPSDLDPATAPLPDEYFVIRALSEGLVLPAMKAGEAPSPGAAERWETSADGLGWTFHLRPGLVWSNGEPLTAADFIASFERVLDPHTPAPRVELFPAIDGFAAPDAATVVVRLKRPEPRFLSYVATGPWIPVNPRVVARFGRDWTRPEHFVGNGPFVLVEWVPHQRIVVRRNPRYRAAGQIQVDELQFVRFDDSDAEERAFRAREVDVTMALSVDKIPVYQRDHPEELHRLPLAETRFLAFNTQRRPLNDRRVRRALAFALDRERLAVEVQRAGQQPAFRLLPPRLRTPDDRADAVGLYRQVNVKESQRELAEAGYPGGKGFPLLELSAWTGNTGLPLLEAIQAMWLETLGVRVSIANREARVHIAAMRSGGYDIGLVALIPWVDDPVEILGDFVTGNPNNYPHWSDPAYDRLLARGDLAAAERRLLDEAPLSPLYFNAQNYLLRPNLQGWEQNEEWVRDYRFLHLGN